MTCTKCGCEFKEDESTGSDIGLCQDDWEAHADRGWWAMMQDLEPTGNPDEYIRIPRENANV